jgi:hypothetical protein
MRTVLYALVCCVAFGFLGAVVGAAAGVGVAGMVLRPEEATVLVTGVMYGGPLGALAGFTVAGLTFAAVGIMQRRGEAEAEE